MTPEAITERIRSALPDAQVELTGEACSFELLVVSDGFEGKSPLARQRMLLGLFAADLQSGALHALSVRARTRSELSAAPAPGRVHLSELGGPDAARCLS